MVNTAADNIQVLESGHRSLIASVKNVSFLTESLAFRVETGLEKLNASLSEIQSNSVFSRDNIGFTWLGFIANRALRLLWTCKACSSLHHCDCIRTEVQSGLVGLPVITSPYSTPFVVIKLVLATCQSVLSALMVLEA